MTDFAGHTRILKTDHERGREALPAASSPRDPAFAERDSLAILRLVKAGLPDDRIARMQRCAPAHVAHLRKRYKVAGATPVLLSVPDELLARARAWGRVEGLPSLEELLITLIELGLDDHEGRPESPA